LRRLLDAGWRVLKGWRWQINVELSAGARPVYVLMVATSAADWLTAIGTVGAVVVALATPAVSSMLRRRRPALRIELSGSEPDLRAVLDASSDAIVAFWLRFTVTNSGRSTAQAVRAQLRRYWVRQAAKDDHDAPWVECGVHGT
jgi:hypothetical protein